jgi:hypothetical protein
MLVDTISQRRYDTMLQNSSAGVLMSTISPQTSLAYERHGTEFADFGERSR